MENKNQKNEELFIVAREMNIESTGKVISDKGIKIISEKLKNKGEIVNQVSQKVESNQWYKDPKMILPLIVDFIKVLLGKFIK